MELLKELCECSGIPGREQRLREIARRELEPVADEITAHFNPGYVNPNPDKPQWVNPPLEAIMEANGICASIQQLNMPMSEVYTFLESTVQFLEDAD